MGEGEKENYQTSGSDLMGKSRVAERKPRELSMLGSDQKWSLETQQEGPSTRHYLPPNLLFRSDKSFYHSV